MADIANFNTPHIIKRHRSTVLTAAISVQILDIVPPSHSFCSVREMRHVLPSSQHIMLRRDPPTKSPRQLHQIGLIVDYIRALCSPPSWAAFRLDSLGSSYHRKKLGWWWPATGSFGNFRQARRKNRRASKPIDLFALKPSEPSIFCRRLVLIPTWR